MILAAGLTPAWQQILLFDRFTPGEVNRARAAHWCASGKVLNVGLALHHLGAACRTLAVVGGDSGGAIRREFAQLGADARWIESATPTRVCTTILDRATGTTTELVENAAPLAADDLAAFRRAYAAEAAGADVVVLSGSLPAGMPVTFYRELLTVTPGRVVLDARGPELLAALERRPWLVKPNREELARTLGRDALSDGDLPEAMRQLNRRGAEWVVVSQGKHAVWVTSATETFRLQPPAAAVVNPIGCGDCLAAGIAWGLHDGRPPLDAIRLGMAAAAENLSQLLPARIGRERVREIAAGIDLDHTHIPI